MNVKFGGKKSFALSTTPEIDAAVMKYEFENSKPKTIEQIQALFNEVSARYTYFLQSKQLELTNLQ
jgi:hypothetical protein